MLLGGLLAIVGGSMLTIGFQQNDRGAMIGLGMLLLLLGLVWYLFARVCAWWFHG